MFEFLEQLEETKHLRKLKRPEHYNQRIEGAPATKTSKGENS